MPLVADSGENAMVAKRGKKLMPEDMPLILQKIADCESGGKQFNEHGNIVRGRINPLDIGIFQINLKYHRVTAERLGFDLFTEEGNLSYGLWLYQKEGTKPWNWSKSCWSGR